ncbi:DUF3983 domain-containing protein [Bacillus sp. FSL W7-1294]|nr:MULTISPECIES: DUF3983 domain-containing protein [Bacillus cereus group]MED2997237.1 DUF3983 domain-containing protein [Bacillus tropicus]
MARRSKSFEKHRVEAALRDIFVQTGILK